MDGLIFSLNGIDTSVSAENAVLGSKRDMIDLRLPDDESVFPSYGGAGERLTFCSGKAVLTAAGSLNRAKGIRAADEGSQDRKSAQGGTNRC